MDIIAKKYRDLKKRYRKLRNAYNKYRQMVHYKDGEQPPKPEYKEIISELNPFFEPSKDSGGDSGKSHVLNYAINFMDDDDIENSFESLNIPLYIKQNIFILKKNIDFKDKDNKERIKNGDIRTIIINSKNKLQETVSGDFVKRFFNNTEIIQEYFMNVSRIIINNIEIDNLMLSNFLNLNSLKINLGSIKVIDLSNLSKLKHSNISKNQVQKVILTGCVALEYFNASDNKIHTVEGLSTCTRIKHLDISKNVLDLRHWDIDSHTYKDSALDLSGFSDLKDLNISYNQIPEIKLTGCTALEYL